MPEVLVEEFHVTFSVARNLRPPDRTALIRILHRRHFRVQIRTAITQVMRRYPALRPVIVRVTT